MYLENKTIGFDLPKQVLDIIPMNTEAFDQNGKLVKGKVVAAAMSRFTPKTDFAIQKIVTESIEGDTLKVKV
jgi:hypothetical protein